ncbi:MAG TPA: signal peptide peptidase SppA [Elusimicrobiota bacterium]|nr:signal peptide peptidase SppA [Elusimicrobiota bacterium]
MTENIESSSPAEKASAPRRRLPAALAAFYLLSLAAAAFIVTRGSKNRAAAGGPLSGLSSQDSVGWLDIHGPIYTSDDSAPWAQGGVSQWTRKLKDLAATPGVRAIVLDINSPGGSVGAVQELYSQIERVRREDHIPVVALFDDVAASGGYYIASACDRVVAHPGTLTGSIGVIFPISNLQGLFKKIGYQMTPIKSGKFKDIGSPARPLTPAEKKLLQNLVEDAYGQFLAAVSAGRNIPLAQLKPLADGRIFSGRQALADHLVDQLGDSTDALDLAAKLGGIKGTPHVQRAGDHLGDFLNLLQSRFEGPNPLAALSSQLAPPRMGLEYLWPGW